MNCSGTEGLIGIPGSIGGGIYMNASSYDSELTDYVKEVRFYDDKNNLLIEKKENLDFSWRKSKFHQFQKSLIIDAIFQIPKNNLNNKDHIKKKYHLLKIQIHFSRKG